MFYSVDLAIPANTLVTAPVSLRVPLPPGTVRQVDVMVPRGHAGLSHLQIFRGANQVWPTNPDGNFNGDDVVITWQEDYDLDDAPFEFVLRAWNEDDTFAHTLTVRFAMQKFAEPVQRQLERLQQAQAIQLIEVEV